MAHICQHIKLLCFRSAINCLRVCHQLLLNRLGQALTFHIRLNVGDLLQKWQPTCNRRNASALLRSKVGLNSADVRPQSLIKMNAHHDGIVGAIDQLCPIAYRTRYRTARLLFRSNTAAEIVPLPTRSPHCRRMSSSAGIASSVLDWPTVQVSSASSRVADRSLPL